LLTQTLFILTWIPKCERGNNKAKNIKHKKPIGVPSIVNLFLMKTFKSINPFTGKTIATYPIDSNVMILDKLDRTREVQASWGAVRIEKKITLLEKLTVLLSERKGVFAKLMAEEMGKPISQGRSEIEKCIVCCNYYIAHSAHYLADEKIETDASESYISYDPLGCILAIMPWNYPFWQVVRFAVPNLTAGNTIILKHADNVLGCAGAIQELFIDAGYPKGSIQTITVAHEQIEAIIANEVIKGVTLTGSTKAGTAVAAIAGKNLKKTVLELGGNNACVVLKDANLDKYLSVMVRARMSNTGQSCIAAKRFIVVAEIYATFLEKFTKAVVQLKVGDPLHEATEIGVLARPDLGANLKDQVANSIAMGAVVHLGNEVNECAFTPTIITNVTADMPLFKEETFGPIAVVINAANEEEALTLAKETKYGLGTMIFTESIAKATEFARTLEDGAVFINEMVKSDPRLPFGGTKKSGYGKELSKDGMLEFVNKKVIYINK